MRARVIGCSSVLRPFGGRKRRLAVGDASRRASEHADQLLLRKTRDTRRSQRDEERARLLSVRVVGCVEDLLRGDSLEHVEQVDRAPDGCVEEDAFPATESLGERGQIRDAAVGDDQLSLRVGIDEPGEMVGNRRQAASAVDENGDATLGREGEDRRQPLVVEQKALGSRMELDPACAAVEAASRLLDRPLREIEPDKRDQYPAGALGSCQGAVVRSPKGRLAVGLVEAEGEGALDAVALQDRDQLFVGGDETIDVVSDVDVGVEELRAWRDEANELVVEGRNETACSLDGLFHGFGIYRGRMGSWGIC